MMAAMGLRWWLRRGGEERCDETGRRGVMGQRRGGRWGCEGGCEGDGREAGMGEGGEERWEWGARAGTGQRQCMAADRVVAASELHDALA